MLLYSPLSFNEYVQSKANKCYNIIGPIKKLSIYLPREAFRTYKSFFRLNLDYGDMIFDKANNESLKSRIESIQCKACKACIWRAIQGTCRERLYRELGLETLSERRWFRKLTFFYKIVKGLSARYPTKYVNLKSTSSYQTRLANKTIHKNFPSEPKPLSILFSLLVLENGTNYTTPYEMLNLLSNLNRG